MQGWGRLGVLMAGAGATAAFALPVQAQAQAWRFHADPVLGTSLDVVAMAGDRTTARVAADAALAEIARLDRVLSGWRDDSELSRLNRSGAAPVSPELFEVLSACEHWRRETDGAFDARQGAVFAQRRENPGADPAAITRLWDTAAEADVRLDAATRTVFRPEPVRFAPEALAKGYVVDAALASARAAAPGLSGLMIDIGGDLRCWGAGPDGAKGWIVGVADPAAGADNAEPGALVRVTDRALATSGLRDEGYHHIVGGEAVLSATVLATTTAEADALATALCAMPARAGMDMVDRLPGVEARVARRDGRIDCSRGWDALTVTPAQAPARLIRAADSAAAPWPAKFGVTVNYELPKKGARAYSPYVAIWVTDENSKLVRALTMLGGKLDYVSENYVWWRRFGRSHPQVVATVTRPTKRPGKYSLVWDGKDDMGMAVGQGKYTVHIEATREDGQHSYQSMDLMLGSDPVDATAMGGEELEASSAHYGPKR